MTALRKYFFPLLLSLTIFLSTSISTYAMCSNQSIHHTYTHISWKNSLSWSFYTSGAVWFHHPKATFSIANVSYPTSATRKMCNVVHHF